MGNKETAWELSNTNFDFDENSHNPIFEDFDGCFFFSPLTAPPPPQNDEGLTKTPPKATTYYLCYSHIKN